MHTKQHTLRKLAKLCRGAVDESDMAFIGEANYTPTSQPKDRGSMVKS